MSAQPPSTRRLAIAIGTAAASVTIAVGVTTASLLGWFSPNPAAPSETVAAAPDPAPSPVILVPVSPDPPPTGPTGGLQLVADEVPRFDDHEAGHHRDRREHGRRHHEEEGEDDD